MSDLRQRREPIRSKALREAARGELAAWLRQHSAYAGDDCLIWPFGRRSSGYGMATVDGVKISAHRHMCILAHGRPPTPDHQAAHSCGNGHLGCVNPRHLSWKTRLANKADELLHGTRNRGERCGSARLSRVQVLAIRARHDADRVSNVALATEYGVSDATIRDVVARRTWGWL